jgi:hypothetical protein
MQTIEKGFNIFNHLRTGCILVFANLFFLGFCMWGVYAGYISWKLQQEGQITAGLVVEMEESESPEGGRVYSPIIEFNIGGQTYSIEGDTASNPPAYHAGQEVRVIYDPSNPNTAQIDKFTERWLMPLCLIPSMVIAALLTNFFVIRAWRRGEHVE